MTLQVILGSSEMYRRVQELPLLITPLPPLPPPHGVMVSWFDQDARNPGNRQKLLRYNSKMEQEHGPHWRQIMEEEDREFGQEGAADRVGAPVIPPVPVPIPIPSHLIC